MPDKVDEKAGELSPLRLELSEKQSGVVARIIFTGEHHSSAAEEDFQIPPGGLLTLALNGHVIFQEAFTGTTLAIERKISLQTVPSGEHLLGCELQYSLGTIHQAEVAFLLRAAPSVEISRDQEGEKGFDPFVTLNFLGEGEETVGFFEVAMDEHPVGMVEVTAQDNGNTRKLSEWLGSPLKTATLPQGIHLVKITAHGLNGEETARFVSFAVDHLPEVNTTVDKEGNIEVIKASFHPAEEIYAGAMDIFYQQGVILSLQSREPTLTVHKKDLMNAFVRHNLALPQQPVSLVVCLRAANASENWHVVSFLP
ncbi:hypothetical protein [Desulfobulbus alkaliphilus]|uniref:hypothetical protein n=1 Tax=Desulfobulbus alkaliphilus TaxID=869814 RepID=UPI001966110E|nr:hypothetical protein [Desulfobulbus alkaliphilus]MBM9536061.1 hypothetical protein [Desulfobulbus alkaliphilus]